MAKKRPQCYHLEQHHINTDGFHQTCVHLLMTNGKWRSSFFDIKRHHINRERFPSDQFPYIVEVWKEKIRQVWYQTTTYQQRTVSSSFVFIYRWEMTRKDSSVVTFNKIPSTEKKFHQISVHLLLRDEKNRSWCCEVIQHLINREAFSEYVCSLTGDRWKGKKAELGY